MYFFANFENLLLPILKNVQLIFLYPKELYMILETREFESRYHHELQEMWYRAHYHEAEKIRARPLGECCMSASIVINKELNFNKSADKSAR